MSGWCCGCGNPATASSRWKEATEPCAHVEASRLDDMVHDSPLGSGRGLHNTKGAPLFALEPAGNIHRAEHASNIPGMYRIVQLVRKAKAGYAGSSLDFLAPPGIRLDPVPHQQTSIAGMAATSKHISGPTRPDHWSRGAACPSTLPGLACWHEARLGTKRAVGARYRMMSRRGQASTRSRLLHARAGESGPLSGSRSGYIVHQDRGPGRRGPGMLPDRQEGPWVRDIVWHH